MSVKHPFLLFSSNSDDGDCRCARSWALLDFVGRTGVTCRQYTEQFTPDYDFSFRSMSLENTVLRWFRTNLRSVLFLEDH